MSLLGSPVHLNTGVDSPNLATEQHGIFVICRRLVWTLHFGVLALEQLRQLYLVCLHRFHNTGHVRRRYRQLPTEGGGWGGGVLERIS